MSYKLKYTKELNFLFAARTKWLRELVGIRMKGRKQVFNKKFLKQRINRLSDFISILKTKKYFLKALRDRTFEKKTYHNKGFGHYDRVERFKNWYNRKIDHKYIIYIFWKNRTCLYVGRTGKGGSRPTHHLGSYRTSGWSRVTIYKVTSSSYMPMLECLAWHLYVPIHGRIKPSNPKWAKDCPLCEDLIELKKEIYSIF